MSADIVLCVDCGEPLTERERIACSKHGSAPLHFRCIKVRIAVKMSDDIKQEKQKVQEWVKTRDPSLAGSSASKVEEVGVRTAAGYLGVGLKFFMDEILPSDILAKRQQGGQTRIEKRSLEIYKHQALNDNPNIPGIIRAIIRGEVLRK